MAEASRWHGHAYSMAAPIPPNTEDARACPCGHKMVVDDSVPEGEARLVDGVTRVGMSTAENLDAVKPAFRSTEFFPACPISAARTYEAAQRAASDLKSR